MKKCKVAVVGAMGTVGQEMLKILVQRNFPAEEIRPLGNPENAGRTVKCGDRELPVQPTTPEAFRGMDVALLAVGESISRALAPQIAKAGCLVIDNSSA